jgi:hypothetical protein
VSLFVILLQASRITPAMSSDLSISILDEALTYMGQRIVSILIQPEEKDKTYITSLHNEVVIIS